MVCLGTVAGAPDATALLEVVDARARHHLLAYVAIARTFTDTFTGINYLNTPSYIIAEIIGGILAVYLIRKIIL